MNNYLQFKIISNEIAKRLKEIIIGDILVDYMFEPSKFYYTIRVYISNKLKWSYCTELTDYDIMIAFENKEKTSRLITEIVYDIISKYKDNIYKNFFFE